MDAIGARVTAAVGLAGQLGHVNVQDLGDRRDERRRRWFVPALDLGDEALAARDPRCQLGLRQAPELAGMGDPLADRDSVGHRPCAFPVSAPQLTGYAGSVLCALSYAAGARVTAEEASR